MSKRQPYFSFERFRSRKLIRPPNLKKKKNVLQLFCVKCIRPDMYWCNENFPSLHFQFPIFEIISNKWRFVNQAIESIKNLNFRIFIQQDINPSDMQTCIPSCLLTLKVFSAEVRVGHFTSRPSDNYCLFFCELPRIFILIII